MPEIDPERQFIVVLKGQHQRVAWGPFDTRGEAEEFAAFATAEIDPAEVRTLSSPVGELLAWREAMRKLQQEGGQP
jgi:hypothetical protein